MCSCVACGTARFFLGRKQSKRSLMCRNAWRSYAQSQSVGSYLLTATAAFHAAGEFGDTGFDAGDAGLDCCAWSVGSLI